MLRLTDGSVVHHSRAHSCYCSCTCFVTDNAGVTVLCACGCMHASCCWRAWVQGCIVTATLPCLEDHMALASDSWPRDRLLLVYWLARLCFLLCACLSTDAARQKAHVEFGARNGDTVNTCFVFAAGCVFA
jgi:hypothetical protein